MNALLRCSVLACTLLGLAGCPEKKEGEGAAAAQPAAAQPAAAQPAASSAPQKKGGGSTGGGW